MVSKQEMHTTTDSSIKQNNFCSQPSYIMPLEQCQRKKSPMKKAFVDIPSIFYTKYPEQLRRPYNQLERDSLESRLLPL